MSPSTSSGRGIKRKAKRPAAQPATVSVKSLVDATTGAPNIAGWTSHIAARSSSAAGAGVVLQDPTFDRETLPALSQVIGKLGTRPTKRVQASIELVSSRRVARLVWLYPRTSGRVRALEPLIDVVCDGGRQGLPTAVSREVTEAGLSRGDSYWSAPLMTLFERRGNGDDTARTLLAFFDGTTEVLTASSGPGDRLEVTTTHPVGALTPAAQGWLRTVGCRDVGDGRWGFQLEEPAQAAQVVHALERLCQYALKLQPEYLTVYGRSVRVWLSSTSGQTPPLPVWPSFAATIQAALDGDERARAAARSWVDLPGLGERLLGALAVLGHDPKVRHRLLQWTSWFTVAVGQRAPESFRYVKAAQNWPPPDKRGLAATTQTRRRLFEAVAPLPDQGTLDVSLDNTRVRFTRTGDTLEAVLTEHHDDDGPAESDPAWRGTATDWQFRVLTDAVIDRLGDQPADLMIAGRPALAATPVATTDRSPTPEIAAPAESVPAALAAVEETGPVDQFFASPRDEAELRDWLAGMSGRGGLEAARLRPAAIEALRLDARSRFDPDTVAAIIATTVANAHAGGSRGSAWLAAVLDETPCFLVPAWLISALRDSEDVPDELRGMIRLPFHATLVMTTAPFSLGSADLAKLPNAGTGPAAYRPLLRNAAAAGASLLGLLFLSDHGFRPDGRVGYLIALHDDDGTGRFADVALVPGHATRRLSSLTDQVAAHLGINLAPRQAPAPSARRSARSNMGARRTEAPSAAHVIDVRGYRPSHETGTGAGHRTHVRRAHWHRYWVGPKHDQALEWRWLAPIWVSGQGPPDDRTVIYRL